MGAALTVVLGRLAYRLVDLSVAQILISGLPLFMLAVAQATTPAARRAGNAMQWILGDVFLGLSVVSPALMAQVKMSTYSWAGLWGASPCWLRA